MDGVFDFKAYLEPYLNNIGGHSKYGAFRFLSHGRRGHEMHYKRCSSDPWEPTKKVENQVVSDIGLQIIKVIFFLGQHLLHYPELFFHTLRVHILATTLYIRVM